MTRIELEIFNYCNFSSLKIFFNLFKKDKQYPREESTLRLPTGLPLRPSSASDMLFKVLSLHGAGERG